MWIWSKIHFLNRCMKSDLTAEASPFDYFGHQSMDSKEREWSMSHLCIDENLYGKRKRQNFPKYLQVCQVAKGALCKVHSWAISRRWKDKFSTWKQWGGLSCKEAFEEEQWTWAWPGPCAEKGGNGKEFQVLRYQKDRNLARDVLRPNYTIQSERQLWFLFYCCIAHNEL